MSSTVLVTGASRGIGWAMSSLLNQSGYQVIGIARGGDKNKFPGYLINCDLADIQQTDNVLNQIQQQFKNVDCVINNVGIVLPEAIGQIKLDSLNSVLDLNVRTAVQVTQAFLPAMKENKYGRIINIGSRAISGSKNRSSYSAAKSALIGLTKTWALELAAYGITVNAVSPGPVETELFRQTIPVGSAAEKERLAQIPLGRIGKPEEIAATVLFLLSDAAGFITGQNICVDGGGSL